jgi:ATP/maltotriose-dependent transcriptional regulator MalT
VAPGTWADRAGTTLALSEALEPVGDPHTGLASAEETIRVAAERGDRLLEWRGRIRRAFYVVDIDPHGPSTAELRAELERAVVVFEELEDELGLAMAWRGLAELEWMPCRFDAAARAARLAVEHARRAGDRRAWQRAVEILAGSQMMGTANSAEVLRTLEDEFSPLLPNKLLEAFDLGRRAELSAYEGDFERAREYARAASAIADGLGLERLVLDNTWMEAYIEQLAGNHQEAEAKYRLVDASLEQQGDAGHRSTSSVLLARVLCSLARYDEAERFAAIGLELCAEDDAATQAIARSVQALVRSARGDHAEAERLAREGVAIYEDAGAENPDAVGDAWMDLALVLRHAGKRADADGAARSALALYESKGVRPKVHEAERFIEGLQRA